jgi:hypothetical protein
LHTSKSPRSGHNASTVMIVRRTRLLVLFTDAQPSAI